MQNILISELQLIIKLPSITEMPVYTDDPLLSEDQKDSLFWYNASQAQNKKVVTYWNNGSANNRLVEFVIFRRDPYYIENLLNRFTSLSAFVLQAGTSLSLQVEATNSGLLAASDSLRVWGQAEVLGV